MAHVLRTDRDLFLAKLGLCCETSMRRQDWLDDAEMMGFAPAKKWPKIELPRQGFFSHRCPLSAPETLFFSTTFRLRLVQISREILLIARSKTILRTPLFESFQTKPLCSSRSKPKQSYLRCDDLRSSTSHFRLRRVS